MLALIYSLLAQAPASMFPYAGPSVGGPLMPTPDPISTPSADPFSGGNYGFSGGTYAQPPSTYPYQESVNTLPNPLGISTLAELVEKLVQILAVVAAPVVTAMVLWGAWKITTSAGDAAKVKEGGKIIGYAALGFGIMLLAGGVTEIIQSLFS